MNELVVVGASLYVSGLFYGYRDTQDAPILARLATGDGTLDTGFQTGAPYGFFDVQTLVPDGDQIFVGGDFGYYDGETWVSRAMFIDAATGALR